MKLLYTITLAIQSIPVLANTSSDTKPHPENYTLASESTNNLADQVIIAEMPRRPSDTDEILELDPNNVALAMAPEDMTQYSDRSDPMDCPPEAPWTCDGVTCFNRFTHNCCKGGHVCQDPLLCIRDAAGQISCK